MVSAAASAAAAVGEASYTGEVGEEQQEQQQQQKEQQQQQHQGVISTAEKEAVNATCTILSDHEKELSWLLEEDLADPNRDTRRGYNWDSIEQKASPALCQTIQRHRKHPRFGNISMQLLLRFKFVNEFKVFRQRVKMAILAARHEGGGSLAPQKTRTTSDGGNQEEGEDSNDSHHRKRPRLQGTASPTSTKADPVDPSNRPRRVPEAGLVAALPPEYKELAFLWHQSGQSSKDRKPNWDKIQEMASGPLQELLIEKRSQYGNFFDQQAVECLIPVKERRAFNIVMSQMDSKPSRTAATTPTATAGTHAAANTAATSKSGLGKRGRGTSPPKLKTTTTNNQYATTTTNAPMSAAAITTDVRRRKKRLESFHQQIQQDLDDFRQDEFVLMNKLIMDCKREQALLLRRDGNHHAASGDGYDQEQGEEE